jgi:hypothetical protein
MWAIYPLTYLSKGGWVVDFCRKGKLTKKIFTTARHGNIDLALIAAKAWRDTMALTVPALTKAEYCGIIRRSNTSGHPGVYRQTVKKRTKAGVDYVQTLWQARTPDGVLPARKKSFLISRYGEQQAYELAVKAREAFLKCLDDQRIFHQTPHRFRPLLQLAGCDADPAQG